MQGPREVLVDDQALDLVPAHPSGLEARLELEGILGRLRPRDAQLLRRRLEGGSIEEITKGAGMTRQAYHRAIWRARKVAGVTFSREGPTTSGVRTP